MTSFVINDVCMIGWECMAHEQLIISAEYMSLKELIVIVHGIKIIDGEVVAIMIITSSMIYLVNADQLLNNNIKTITTHHQLPLVTILIKWIDTMLTHRGSRNGAR